ncbi:MAG TPA: extracellular solute-binding protein [Alphaproteobacteria bacterium]|nr:extracellular solute-binding protein [Alphaproteobacteria bacterium]
MRKPIGPGQFLATLNRREFLKGSTAAAVGAAAAPALWTLPAHAQQNVLTLLSWPGYAAPEVVGPFEQATGVKIVGKEYTGGDNMLALLNSSPPGTFDLVLSDAEYLHMLREADLIQKLEPADFPMDDFWPEFQKFSGFWADNDMYAIMTSFGYLGMTYNADKLTREEMESYKIMWDPKVEKKVGMYDWYLPPMLCLSLYDGNKPPYDITDEQFAKLKETLFSLKPQVVGIGAFAGAFSMLSQGEAWIMPGTGAWLTLLLKKDGVPVDDIVPEEGGLQWSEGMAIAKATSKPELALKFLQYMASPEGQMRVAIKPAYSGSIPSKAGWKLLGEQHPDWSKLLLHELDKPNVMDEYAKGKIFIRDLPKQQSLEEWNQAFTEFKNL